MRCAGDAPGSRAPGIHIWRACSSHSGAMTQKLTRREWVPSGAEDLVQRVAAEAAAATIAAVDARVHDLIDENRRIHEVECINLNPATNVMNPRAEAVLASGVGSRPSLGYPGEKYEMGLEAIEQIEIIAAELAAEVFRSNYAEIRVPSGAIANLYAFMTFADPGDVVIVPPASIGGHVTHNRDGAAGLYQLDIHEAPIDAERYTVDVAALAESVVDAVRLGLEPADTTVLDRYEAWRRVDNTTLVTVTDVLNRLFSNDLALIRVARDLGLAGVGAIPPLKRVFMRHAMGVIGDLPRLVRGEAL